MDAWLLTDDHDLAQRVHESMLRMHVSCPESRVVSIASLENVITQLAECDLFVFAVLQLHESHIDLLQRIRLEVHGTLVVVAALPPQAILLKAIRAGADDFIDAEAGLEFDFDDLVSRCEARRSKPEIDAHLTTVIPCQASGDGNLLAVNVAAQLAQTKGTCLLLDFHMRGGDLALMLSLAPQHTFLELVRQRRNIDRSMLEQALTLHKSGIRLLAGPEMFSDLHDIQLHVSQQILDIAKSIAPHVVVAIEDLQHAEQVHALTKSETVVLVVRTDVVSLARAKQHVRYLVQTHVPEDRICIAALSSGVEGEIPINSFKKVLRTPRIHVVPEDASSVMMSVNLGNPLVLEYPKSKMARALVELTEALRTGSAMRVAEVKLPPARLVSATPPILGTLTRNR